MPGVWNVAARRRSATRPLGGLATRRVTRGAVGRTNATTECTAGGIRSPPSRTDGREWPRPRHRPKHLAVGGEGRRHRNGSCAEGGTLPAKRCRGEGLRGVDTALIGRIALGGQARLRSWRTGPDWASRHEKRRRERALVRDRRTSADKDRRPSWVARLFHVKHPEDAAYTSPAPTSAAVARYGLRRPHLHRRD